MSLFLCSVCNPMPSGSKKVMCQWPKKKLCFLMAKSLPSCFLARLTNPQSKLQSVSPSEWFLKAQRGSDIFQMTIFLSWPFCCPFWWVIAFFEIFICELCHLRASWWWKTLLCGVKVMEISSVTLPVCFSSKLLFFPSVYILQCTCQRNYPGGICSGEKEIRSAYEYCSKVSAGER